MSNALLAKFPRRHLFKFGVIFLSITVFCIAFFIRDNAQQELNTEKGKLQQQQQLNNSADDSARLLSLYIEPYKILQQQGVVGEPKRLWWLESVQANAGEIRIPKFNLILSATELTTDAVPFYHDAELTTKTTLMQVSFSLLHEGDFYHFLHGLQLQAQGIYNVEECTIRRSDGLGGNRANQKLEGEFVGGCYLRWYSMADVTQSWQVSVP